MSGKLISILMPFKNEERYLEECIESIRGQSIENWELFAVDDHSTDISSEIVKRHQKLDPRIAYIQNDGSGIIDALKTGFNVSRGEFIHRMDADDIMPLDKLEILSQTLIQAGKGHVATGHVRYFSETGISEGYLNYENWLNSLCENESHWDNIFQECVIASPAWLLHKSDLESIGGFNSELYPEDYDLVFRMNKNGMKVKASKDIIHYWREHSQRTSRTNENYGQEAFLNLKLHYFLMQYKDSEKNLTVIGSGVKSKTVRKILRDKNIEFTLIDKIDAFHNLNISEQNQYILLFADSESKRVSEDRFIKSGLGMNRDYFFFS